MAGEGSAADSAGAEATAADSSRVTGRAAVTGAAGKSGRTPAARESASWVAMGTVGPIASKAGVASTAASRRKAWRALGISVIVLGLLSLMILNVVSTNSQCPGLPSDQVMASAAVRYAACNHSTDAWSKGAR